MISLKQLEADAISVLRSFEPEEGYYLGYSGGKDSDVILALAKLSGVKFHAVHNHTTVDAPETVYYVRKMRDDPENHLTIDYPDTTMWRLIVDHCTVPTRVVRFCCEELKERGGRGEKCIMGVRKAESVKRAASAGLVRMTSSPKTAAKIAEEQGAEYTKTKQGGIVLNIDDAPTRQTVEMCYRTIKTMINPIVDWSDADVWTFLRYYGIEANPLYREGYRRVGCVGCPMSCRKKYELERYPKYRENYLKAIGRMLVRRKERNMPLVEAWGGKDATAESVMRWWLEDEIDESWVSMFEEKLL